MNDREMIPPFSGRRIPSALASLTTIFRTSRCEKQPGFALVTAVLVGTGVLLLRQSGVSALDSVWAEDAAIFLQDALDLDFSKALTSTHGGYLHVLPRFIAEFAVWLPAQWWAAAMSGAGALAGAATALFVFQASGAHLPTVRIRAALALAVLLLPAAGLEPANSACNAHWYLLFASFWGLLWRPRGSWGIASAAAVVLLGALSDPFVVLFAPIALLRVLVLPRGRDQVVSFSFMLGAAAQLAAIATSPESRALLFLHRPIDLARWHGFHVIEVAAFGIRQREALLEIWGVFLPGLAAVALLGAVSLPARRLRREHVPFLALCGVYHGAIYAVPVILAGLSSARYTFVPLLLLMTMLAYVVEQAGPQLSRRGRSALLWGITLILVAQWGGDFAPANVRSPGPSWGKQVAKARERCSARQSEIASLVAAPVPWEQSESREGGTTRLWTLEVGCNQL